MKRFVLGFIIGGIVCFALTGFAVEYAVTANPFPIKVDGAIKSIEGYNINDSTYFKLRDVADAVGGFTVGFTNNTITISTQAEPSEPANTDAPITIHEGEISQRRFAREGDTVIKADGTEVVLAIGPHGVLGEGQGVAPDVGLMDEIGQGDAKFTAPLEANGRLITGKYGPNSVGKEVSDSQYWVNPLTGEGHWDSEWAVISDYTLPKEQGTEEGEISPDNNYIWNGMCWVTLACDNGRVVFNYYNK